MLMFAVVPSKPQLSLIKPYSPLIFQIKMRKLLLRTKPARRVRRAAKVCAHLFEILRLNRFYQCQLNSYTFSVNAGCWIISTCNNAKSLCWFGIPCMMSLIANVISIHTFVTRCASETIGLMQHLRKIGLVHQKHAHTKSTRINIK